MRYALPAIIIALALYSIIMSLICLHTANKQASAKVWGVDPAVPMPHFSVEKNGREEREKASGIVIDPGGTCLCRRCGHTVSALHDSCINCFTPINWNA